MKRIALACALMACGVDHVVEQRIAQAPEVGAQGVAGATGPAGEVGPAGADGAPGAAGAWEVYGGDGSDLGPLVTVIFAGAAPVYVTMDGARFVQREAFGGWMRSQGVFSETQSCDPPLFVPEDSPGRLESDALATFVLNAYGADDGMIARAEESSKTRDMAAYVVYAPDGSATCVTVMMGPTPSVAVTLLRRERATGPLHLAPR